MPIYEYSCKKCGHIFEVLENHKNVSWKLQNKQAVYCNACKTKNAYRIPSAFKIGNNLLETTGKSGYETDDLTLGKLVDEGGIPYEEKNRLRDREKLIKRQKKYTEELNERAKRFNFEPNEL